LPFTLLRETLKVLSVDNRDKHDGRQRRRIRAPREPLQVFDGGLVTVRAPRYANAIFRITDDSAEVFTVVPTGHARISDPGHDYLVGSDGTYCHRLGGCVCPNQDVAPPPLDLPGPDILLVLNNGELPAHAAVQGRSLEDYCLHPPDGQA
jgi:hypothetical protein